MFDPSNVWKTASFLADLAITYGMVILAAYIGIKIADRTGKRWQGWFAFAASVCLLYLVSQPVVMQLRDHACADQPDRKACLNGLYGDY